MESLFNLDNGFFTFMGKLFDLVIVSIMWTLCCIPIFTVGPATSALYYAIVKSIRKDRGYVTKEFFKAFRMNFKTGAATTLLLIAVVSLLIGDIRFANSLGGNKGAALMTAFRIIIVIVAFVTVYLFPVLSRFTIPVFKLIRTCFLMSIRHIVSTLLMVVLFTACGLAIYCYPILTLILPGVCLFLQSFLMERILKRYTPKAPEGEEPLDAWYLD